MLRNWVIGLSLKAIRFGISLMLAITQIGVERIAQGISQEIKGKHRKGEGQGWKEDHMGAARNAP